MSKATRNKAQNVAKKQRQKEKLQQERRKKRIELTVALSVIGVLVLSVVGVLIANKIHEDYLDSGKGLRNVIAMSSDNYSVDNAMLTYFIYNDYYYYVNYYGDNASYYGIDEDLELSEQYYNESSGITWLDYCTDEAITNLKSMLLLCEDAKANNFTLTDEENAEISKMLETVTPSSYGRGVNLEDIRKSLEISYLASNYQDSLKAGISISDQEIESYYNENAKDYQTCQYISYTVHYADEADEDNAEITEEEAAAYTDILKACKTEKEFKNAVSDYLKETDNDITDEKIKEAIDAIAVKKLTYTAEEDLSEWAFGADRKIGDTMSVLEEDDECYTVYMLTALPERNEDNVINVRHILFDFDNYETEAEAKAAAEKVLKEYQDGEQTEDRFAELATKYNEDPGSSSTGGLYEGVTRGQMVATFNDWCFDETRKSGDVDIVKTEFGYHIMYFVNKGEAEYKSDIRATLETEEYNEIFEEIKNRITVTTNNAAITEITGKELTENTASNS